MKTATGSAITQRLERRKDREAMLRSEALRVANQYDLTAEQVVKAAEAFYRFLSGRGAAK